MHPARQIVISAHGGPEVLQLVEAEVGDPGEGAIRVAHKAVGLNFIDVYQRTGLYPGALPFVPGREAAGIVEAVGAGVTHLKEGDRVAYVSSASGAYCDRRVLDATQVVRLPDAISFEEGAAMMLKGMTVEYLFEKITPIARGETVLFHAAAGGVGLIACQWARSEGIHLIGTAGSADKCALALENGAAHAINYREEDFVARVKEITGGKGVPVVMDSIGKDTFDGSLDCLAPLGMMMSYGNASGPVPPFNIGVLGQKGSLKLTRPTLFTFIATRDSAQAMADRLFEKVVSGDVTIHVGQSFPLENVADAHRALEGRATTGSTVLTV